MRRMLWFCLLAGLAATSCSRVERPLVVLDSAGVRRWDLVQAGAAKAALELNMDVAAAGSNDRPAAASISQSPLGVTVRIAERPVVVA